MIRGDELRRAYQALAPGMAWPQGPTEEQFETVAALANEQVSSEQDVPAALFYALGRYPRLLAGAWVDFSRLTAGAAAWRRGRQLVVSRELARRWLVDIAGQRLSFAETRNHLEALMVSVSSSGS